LADTPADPGEASADAPKLQLDLDSKPDAVGPLYERAASDRGISVEELRKGAGSDASTETDDRATENTKSYAPRERAQDTTRQIITLWLIGLFCVLIALSFVALFIIGLKSPGGFDDSFFAKLKTLLDVLLGPVITLLSSAIGFYFGYQQGSGSLGKDVSRDSTSQKPGNGI
jgi:hypothetical protein